jgi:tRNA threonylcarbamoyladenosine biosynthesis protein TsaE
MSDAPSTPAQYAVGTADAAETQALAARLAALIRPGDLILLTGPIGGGKTTFAQGLAAALGVSEVVASPTFQLHAVYDGRLRVNHLDFYRLGSEREAEELAVEEALEGDAMAMVEWGDRFEVFRPPYLTVDFGLGDGPDDRRVTFTATGESWEERVARMALEG